MKYRHWLVATAAVSLAIAPRALAQAAKAPEASAAAEQPTTEVIVTAQRRSERLKDVPISVTALTDRTVVKRGFFDAIRLSRFSARASCQASSPPVIW